MTDVTSAKEILMELFTWTHGDYELVMKETDPSPVVTLNISTENLIIATGQNNLAMNRTVTQIAKHYIHRGEASDGVLNRLEAGIRAYDPCLSCSTHAIGMMPLVVDVLDVNGKPLRRWKRDN